MLLEAAMRIAIVPLLPVLYTSPFVLSAQANPLVELGSRVRVTAPGLAMHKQVATLEAWRGDTLVISRPWTMDCPLASVTSLEVTRERKSNTIEGLSIGLFGGAALGGILGAVAYDESNEKSLASNEGEAAFRGAILFGGVGGLVGLGIGAFTKSDRWEEVPLDRLRVSVAAQRKGRLGIGFSLKF
jgi:hypothetical protein